MPSIAPSAPLVIEIQRREGDWVPSEIGHPTIADLYRFAAALGRWIGDPRGNVAAVRIRPIYHNES